MIEEIYNFFTVEMLYFWVNLGVLPFWLTLIFFPNSQISRIFVTSIFPIFILSGGCLNQDLAYAINELNLSNGLNINIKLDDNKFNNEVKKSLLFEFNQLLKKNKNLIK